uniref:Uncharacterized protein n=1 Tax=Sphaerodactylus townsendi TaxID=933632 RepID=A0ACB8FC40_9SAUR
MPQRPPPCGGIRPVRPTLAEPVVNMVLVNNQLLKLFDSHHWNRLLNDLNPTTAQTHKHPIAQERVGLKKINLGSPLRIWFVNERQVGSDWGIDPIRNAGGGQLCSLSGVAVEASAAGE